LRNEEETLIYFSEILFYIERNTIIHYHISRDRLTFTSCDIFIASDQRRLMRLMTDEADLGWLRGEADCWEATLPLLTHAG